MTHQTERSVCQLINKLLQDNLVDKTLHTNLMGYQKPIKYHHFTHKYECNSRSEELRAIFPLPAK